MRSEEEITLNPGKFSKVIHKKPEHEMYIGIVQGKGIIIQLDLRKSRNERPKIKMDESGVSMAKLEGDHFKIIASPDSSRPFTVIIEQIKP